MPQLRVAGKRHELRLRSCQVSLRGENPGSRFLRRGTAHINLGKKEYEFASRLREESIDRTRSCPGRHPEGGRSAAATPPDPSGRRAHMKRLSTHPRRRGTTRAQDVLCRVQAMHGRQ